MSPINRNLQPAQRFRTSPGPHHSRAAATRALTHLGTLALLLGAGAVLPGACSSARANGQGEGKGKGKTVSEPTSALATHSREDRVARGRMLVSIGGCNDCHTPMKFDAEIGMPMPDMTRMLSGHPEGAPDPASALSGHDNATIGPTFTSFRLPFGVVYTANLTPDRATGLGAWTEEMFLAAVRTGRHMGGQGRPILPPMPWTNLAPQTDEDLKSIFAYLRSIPAVRNDVPAPKVPAEAMAAIAASYDKAMARVKAKTRAQTIGDNGGGTTLVRR